jgi:hypothetical protein
MEVYFSGCEKLNGSRKKCQGTALAVPKAAQKTKGLYRLVNRLRKNARRREAGFLTPA